MSNITEAVKRVVKRCYEANPLHLHQPLSGQTVMEWLLEELTAPNCTTAGNVAPIEIRRQVVRGKPVPNSGLEELEEYCLPGTHPADGSLMAKAGTVFKEVTIYEYLVRERFIVVREGKEVVITDRHIEKRNYEFGYYKPTRCNW